MPCCCTVHTLLKKNTDAHGVALCRRHRAAAIERETALLASMAGGAPIPIDSGDPAGEDAGQVRPGQRAATHYQPGAGNQGSGQVNHPCTTRLLVEYTVSALNLTLTLPPVG
jgi:hypothetical protein